MPMMATYDHNDARDTALRLATRTLEGLRDRATAPLNGNAINNMYRLLQGWFGSNGFYGYVDDIATDEDGLQGAFQESADRNVGELRIALDRSFTTAFDGSDRRSAMSEMKVVLRMVAFPTDGQYADDEQVERTTRFFQTLVDRLDD